MYMYLHQSYSAVPAVVDQFGFLWTGSGPFLFNSADNTTHSVLRFDTSSTTSAILAVQVSDEANVSLEIQIIGVMNCTNAVQATPC